LATEISVLFEANLDPGGSVPLYRQLYTVLRDAILAGRLQPGERLPSTRSLALTLRCSRNRVTEAYEMLASEGYLEGRIGAGSYVSLAFSDLWAGERPPRLQPVSGNAEFELSQTGRALFAMEPERRPESGRQAAGSIGPDPEAFPVEAWTRALTRAWKRSAPDVAFHADPLGYRPLREAIADYLGKVRAIDSDAEQIMITSGAQHALDLIARLLLNPGDRVWIEDPSYRGARAALVAAGAAAVPVPVGDEGFDAERAAELASGAKAAVVTPSHQFPLGVTMSLAKRLKLLDWAAASNGWIVEDDYDSEFRYTGRPIPALHGLDRGRRVIYVGTFSKAMFPGLRIGYVVLPPGLADPFRAARGLLDGHTGMVGQLALADFIGEGQFSAHLRRMRAHYAKRREVALYWAREKLASFMPAPPGEAGMHLLIHLDPGIDDREVAQCTAKAGVECQPLSAFHAGASVRSGLVLGFGAASDDAIRVLIEDLARILRDQE
jgi:GntR family transcriptional regulator/MocR family aminotransferase